MRYLTNIDPSLHYRNHDSMTFMVYVAALRSGQNVKYLTCAMPNHWTGTSADCNHYGCIVGIDNEHDYSRFWREYDKLEDVNV